MCLVCKYLIKVQVVVVEENISNTMRVELFFGLWIMSDLEFKFQSTLRNSIL